MESCARWCPAFWLLQEGDRYMMEGTTKREKLGGKKGVVLFHRLVELLAAIPLVFIPPNVLQHGSVPSPSTPLRFHS